MNASEELQEWANKDVDNIADFDQLEKELEAQLEEQMAELQGFEEEREKIGNPDSLGDLMMDVIYDQFVIQLGIDQGEEFKRKNNGLTLDLRDSAHIQTADNFEQGKIATHNHISKDQLEKNLKRYKTRPHKDFRKNVVNKGMDKVLPRAGKLNEQGIETVRDIYTGRQISTKTELENGGKNREAAQREHVKSSDKLYHDPTLQMSYDDQGLADVINDPNNLQGYTTLRRNNDKSNRSSDEMNDKDKTKHWEKANKKADKHIEQKKREGKDRLEAEGRQTQKEEAVQFGKNALKSVLMAMLASLVRDIIRNLVIWFRSGEKKFASFIDYVKNAIISFFKNIKQHLISAGKSLATSLTTMIITAVINPVVGMIKKAWVFLKQGYKSIKEAVAFFKNPANKNMPFSLKMLNVGKIVIAGLTAGGAVVLGEVIEKGLMTIPGFALEIPLFGSLASILGVFFGALVSGIIGALALNMIDRLIAKKQKSLNTEKLIEAGNAINETQDKLTEVVIDKTKATVSDSLTNIQNQHKLATEIMSTSLSKIKENAEEIDKPVAEFVDAEEIADAEEMTDTEDKTGNETALGQIFSDLQDLK